MFYILTLIKSKSAKWSYKNYSSNQAALETDPSATKPSESLIDVGTGQKVTNGTLWGGNSLRTLEHSLLAKQQGNNKAQLPSQAEKSDVTGIVQVKAATTPKKRGRKPKSLQKPEEVCYDSMTSEKWKSCEEPYH